MHTSFIDKHLDPTASVKVCPLLDDESLADWRQLTLNEIEAEGARRASGRGIFSPLLSTKVRWLAFA